MAEKSYSEFIQRMVDKNEIGGCEFFDSFPWLNAANQLIAADDPLRALWLLDLLPGRYRDNTPKEILELRKEITRRLATPAFYAENKEDMVDEWETAKATIQTSYRGQAVLHDVLELNKRDKVPHLVDMGPGTYWLPLGLIQMNVMFTYSDIVLCTKAREMNMKYLEKYYTKVIPENRPRIFIACELIEHLHFENEIAVECHGHNVDPDIIHISTPLYSFDGRQECLSWQNKTVQPHLRTYTPREFTDTVASMFPGYTWNFFPANIMHMRGIKNGTSDNFDWR